MKIDIVISPKIKAIKYDSSDIFREIDIFLVHNPAFVSKRDSKNCIQSQVPELSAGKGKK